MAGANRKFGVASAEVCYVFFGARVQPGQRLRGEADVGRGREVAGDGDGHGELPAWSAGNCGEGCALWNMDRWGEDARAGPSSGARSAEIGHARDADWAAVAGRRRRSRVPASADSERVAVFDRHYSRAACGGTPGAPFGRGPGYVSALFVCCGGGVGVVAKTREQGKAVIGAVDIGGTKIAVGMVDDGGKVLSKMESA